MFPFIDGAKLRREWLKKNNPAAILERQVANDDARKETEEFMCSYCGDTGTVDDYVYDMDSHQYQPTETRRCVCQLKEVEYDNQE
jgi:hypothetical protein